MIKFQHISNIKRSYIETLIAVLPVYFFIIVGFILKRSFKEAINEKSYVILSFYFLQPILVFWGLTKAPIDYGFIVSPIIYYAIIFTALILLTFVSKAIFSDKKDQNIYLAVSLVGNTGNIGIPLGIALFGEQSVPYTSIINIANMFFIYIFSVYFFARGNYHFKDALVSILKLPGVWMAVLAIVLNHNQVVIPENISKVLEMGAYAAIVLQLIVFGVYLSEVKLKTTNFKLTFNITFVKHLLLPTLGLVFVLQSDLSAYVASILVMQLMVPLAVNNVNLAALYDSKPYEVTASVLVSAITFAILLYFYLYIIEYYLG